MLIELATPNSFCQSHTHSNLSSRLVKFESRGCQIMILFSLYFLLFYVSRLPIAPKYFSLLNALWFCLLASLYLSGLIHCFGWFHCTSRFLFSVVMFPNPLSRNCGEAGAMKSAFLPFCSCPQGQTWNTLANTKWFDSSNICLHE